MLPCPLHAELLQHFCSCLFVLVSGRISVRYQVIQGLQGDTGTPTWSLVIYTKIQLELANRITVPTLLVWMTSIKSAKHDDLLFVKAWKSLYIYCFHWPPCLVFPNMCHEWLTRLQVCEDWMNSDFCVWKTVHSCHSSVILTLLGEPGWSGLVH